MFRKTFFIQAQKNYYLKHSWNSKMSYVRLHKKRFVKSSSVTVFVRRKLFNGFRCFLVVNSLQNSLKNSHYALLT